MEVDRLVELVDLVVWVVDPQKYADAAWHDDYVRSLAAYGESMAVVLNQSDLLDPQALAACRADLARLLAADGVAGGADPRRLGRDRRGPGGATGPARRARRGAGGSRGAAGRRRRRRRRRSRRPRAGARAGRRAGRGPRPAAEGAGRRGRRPDRPPRRRGRAPAPRRARDRLAVLPLAQAAATRTRCAACGSATSRPRTSARRCRAPSDVQVAGVETAARRLAGAAANGMPEPWPRLVRTAATSQLDRAPDELDRAVAGAQLNVRRPLWWRLVGALQTALAAAVAVGLLWLLALLALDYLGLEDVVPDARGPRHSAADGARYSAAPWRASPSRSSRGSSTASAPAGARGRAGKALRGRIDEAAGRLVLDPVAAELDAYGRLCAAVAAAQEPVTSRARPRRGRTGAARGRAGAAPRR